MGIVGGSNFVVVGLPEGDIDTLRRWLESRPTLGILLPGGLSPACSLGAIDGQPASVVEAALAVPLPRPGARVVLGSVSLASVLSAASFEHRAQPSGKAGASRLASVVRSLKRGEHPCEQLRGVDPTSMSDGDPALVHAMLCRVAHCDRLPMRFRVASLAEYVRFGEFTGMERQLFATRRWLERSVATLREGRVGEQTLQRTNNQGGAQGEKLRDDEGSVLAVVPRARARPMSIVRIKPGLLRDQVAADASLYGAWERVRDNARSRGTWSRELARFEARLGAELGRLGAALRDGSWQPGKARHVRLDKPSGGTRHLHVPTVGDRVVERAISRVVSRHVDEFLSPWSFAFRPGRGVSDAVREVAVLRDEGGTHVARFDLADCFDSVDHRRLRSALARFLDDQWLLEVTDQILARELPGLPSGQPLTGIAQGSPLSPLLCNLVLDDLDRGMVSAGFPAVRYADDLALVGRCAVEAREGLRVATTICEHLGFTINPAKSVVVGFVELVEYLGQRVGPDTPPSDPGSDEQPPSKRSLYLTPRAANVHLHRGQVRAVARDRSEILSVPVSGVGQIVCLGPTGLSAGLRSHALRHGVDVVFLSRSGGWLGRLDGDRDLDPALRRAQYRLLDRSDEMVAIARRLVVGKLANQRALLLRYSRRSSAAVACDAAARLEELGLAAQLSASREEAMGYEGVAAKSYYRALAALFPAEARFRTRKFRPPPDPGNATLSFAYVLLTAEVRGAIALAGLDPAVGLLHGNARGRASLALDLMEEFRPLIVDTVALTLFRRRRLKAEHFRAQGDATWLTAAGQRLVVDAYETRMLSRFGSRRSRARITYRDGVREQARHLAAVIQGRDEHYEPITWR